MTMFRETGRIIQSWVSKGFPRDKGTEQPRRSVIVHNSKYWIRIQWDLWWFSDQAPRAFVRPSFWSFLDFPSTTKSVFELLAKFDPSNFQKNAKHIHRFDAFPTEVNMIWEFLWFVWFVHLEMRQVSEIGTNLAQNASFPNSRPNLPPIPIFEQRPASTASAQDLNLSQTPPADTSNDSSVLPSSCSLAQDLALRCTRQAQSFGNESLWSHQLSNVTSCIIYHQMNTWCPWRASLLCTHVLTIENGFHPKTVFECTVKGYITVQFTPIICVAADCSPR